jgi:HAD superfamily hydrolase (TIGR01509 family)
MEWISHFDLFLFDFDGLLVDTERLHHQSYERLCKSRGLAFPWDFHSYCKVAHSKAQAMKEALFTLYPSLYEEDPSWKHLYEEKHQHYVNLLHESACELMPGAAALLEKLDTNQIRHCVATNSPRAHIELIKKKLPLLQSIPHWITREDYTNAKPAPDAYLTAIQLCGRPNDRMVGFEDTARGIQALQKASILPILVAPSYPETLAPGVLHFPSLTLVNLKK